MDGNRGIHLVISPEQDPLIQEGVNLWKRIFWKIFEKMGIYIVYE
jgi:hypothetical protein